MSRGKELGKSTTIIFVGTLCTKVASYFLLPLYTGILNTSEYGMVELFNTFILLLVPIINFHIDQGVFRYLISNRNNRNKIKGYISTTILFTLFSSIIFILLYFCFNPFITVQFKYLLIANIIFNNFSTILLQICRGLGKNTDYSSTSFIIAITTMILNIIFLTSFGMKVDGILYGSLIGYIIGIVFVTFKLKLFKLVNIKNINKKSLKEMLKYSLPLIPSEISWWIFSVSDRYVILWFINMAATGILSIVYKFSSIINIIYNVFNMSLTENISIHINDNDIDKYFNKIFNNIMKLFVSGNLLVIAYMPVIFKTMVNNSYIDAYKYIPIAILSSIFQMTSGMLGTIYAAKKNTKSIAITSALAAFINLIVDLVLVKSVGIYAAVISTLVSYLVLLLYRYYDINKRYFKVNINFKMVMLSNIFLVFSLIIYYFDFTVITKFILISIFTIIIFIFNIDFIKYLFKNFNRNIKNRRENNEQVY